MVEEENELSWATLVAGPAGTEAAAEPANKSKAEAVAMTKRFM
jgi:hypothetical protein